MRFLPAYTLRFISYEFFLVIIPLLVDFKLVLFVLAPRDLP